MNYSELPKVWQRVFQLEWQSVCEGSKAIAAVIADNDGNILSEGRNMISECGVPNPATAHAEAEAVRNLDVSRFPVPKTYTLYAGLEPCIMCMGTLVMGHIRHVEIAARDNFGGAMGLIELSPFARNKGISVKWLDNELSDMQRAFQTLRELMYNKDEEKLKRMLDDFSELNKKGVEAAKALYESDFFNSKRLSDISAEDVFDKIMHKIS